MIVQLKESTMYDAVMMFLICATMFQLGRAYEAVRDLRMRMEEFK